MSKSEFLVQFIFSFYGQYVNQSGLVKCLEDAELAYQRIYENG